ncbi:Dabb family protein [Glycomyces harbinensis]|uniref:Stress responsive A/B Barrel Domain n=1 Tax=Glycomyces harbinensis TaxID=58114 RepID=A0A1G6ZLU3_9ACTN|nr:Stress responsive A/B Barrel Domain [Glycomyces harbinensis]
MIYHGIRFSIKPGLSQEDVDAGLERMRQASTKITAIKSWVVGRDFGGEYQFGAVSQLESLEDYEEMMNHPEHNEIDRSGLPLIDKFASFDITDDPDPELGAKIAAIHQRRFANTPDIADLVANLDDYSGSAAPGKHG